MKLRVCGLGIVATLVCSGTAIAQTCTETGLRHAAPLISADQPNERQLEISGSDALYLPVGPGWIFALEPQKFGWTIAVYDRTAVGDAIDMSMVTPPYQGPANAREISGWHFRNAANTGSNQGDVNAPQHLRTFIFSRALARTGGFRPSTDPATPRFDPPDTGDGLGWFRILDYALSDLEPGEQARMRFLRFEGCITWPKSEDDIQRERDETSPVFIDEDLELFGSCGLDFNRYELDAAILPRKLSGDFDGDDAHDDVAQIRRKSDGARGLAICRAREHLHLAGFTDDGGALEPWYVASMEAWRTVRRNSDPLDDIDEAAWSKADGDILALERIEKQMILLYWGDGQLQSSQAYHFVEP